MIQNTNPTSAHMLGECFDHNPPAFSGIPSFLSNWIACSRLGSVLGDPSRQLNLFSFNSGLSKHFLLNLLVQPVQLLPLTFKDSLHQGFRCWLWHCYRLGHRLTSSPSLDCLGYRFGCLYCFRLLLCAFLSWHNLKLKGSLRR